MIYGVFIFPKIKNDKSTQIYARVLDVKLSEDMNALKLKIGNKLKPAP